MRLEDEKFLAAGDNEGGPTLETEARGFAPDRMVVCAACSRHSPPTRVNCLYCGEALPAGEAADDLRRPALRPLGEWEQGFNVVLPPAVGAGVELAAAGAAEAAALLKIDPAHLQEITRTGELLPLARAASREEAELIVKRIKPFGLEAVVVADDELAIESHPLRRIRRLEFEGEALAGWRRVEQDVERIGWPEIALLVAGRLQRKRIEMDERRRRGADREIVEAREFHADEGVLDIYFAGSQQNWRVTAEGFDYSCLGAQKSLLTIENFRRLTDVLRARAPAAAYHDAYRRVRHLLKFAWPLEEAETTGGLRRARPGRYLSEAVLSVSNERQFTRYGRLLHRYLASQRPPA